MTRRFPILLTVATLSLPAIAAEDPYAKSGNIPPQAVQLTPEKEAEILKDVKVADGFDVTVFAAPPMVNYPVFVAAAPDGTLYVSSDGNGSLGRDPGRGRVIRLRDTDGDGRADETKVFCEVDAPRGLVWDHDRLYLVHPPHLSEFIDADGDGVAEKQNVLVKNIAFGYKDRPADHTTNGLTLGIDGWLYIAGGDFGFMDAEGSDGRHLQHRGGGVIRVRPDGTGLELYCTGTRNILEVAISPTMDLFARDNTNDGGGWNVRFHHLIPGGDHGYPRLFKNFPDECIPPLADYGGGSGCGAVFIDEPGFGEWNNAPFTCDWGTGALWHHQVKPKGATFEETRDPVPFVKMTRPTDADVDAMSHLYVASWKGATFKWEGPDVGYIVRVTPKSIHHAPRDASPENVTRSVTDTFAAAPLPDFDKASDEDLVKLLESPSHRRRMEAQRTFTKRLSQLPKFRGGRELENSTFSSLIGAELNLKTNLQSRAAAMYGLVSLGFDEGDFGIHKRKLGMGSEVDDLLPYLENAQTRALPAALPDSLAKLLKLDSRSSYAVDESSQVRQWPKNQASILRLAAARQIGAGMLSPERAVAVLTDAFADSDRSVQHALRNGCVRAARSCDGKTVVAFGGDVDYAVGKSGIRIAVLQVFDAAVDKTVAQQCLQFLMRMHTPEVVTGLIERLGKATDPELRRGILSALCRLHFHEGEWKGDSWGTRPDTRGPYYQPEPWSETERIAVALKEALDAAEPAEAAFLIQEMRRNRIQSDDALNRVLALAKQDPKVVPDAVAQLAVADEVPAEAVAMLVGVLKSTHHTPRDDPKNNVTRSVTDTLSNAIVALAKTDSADGCAATLATLPKIEDEIARLEAAVKEAQKLEDPNAAKHEAKNARTVAAEARSQLDAAVSAFLGAPKLENHHQFLEHEAEKVGTREALWADAALLKLSTRKSGSPESREMTAKALDAGWAADPARRIQILEAATAIKHRDLAAKVLAAMNDDDPRVRQAAKSAAKRLGVKKVEDTTPKVATLSLEDAIAAVLKTKGDLATGEQIFTKATCVACHTVSENEAQKGPYLGNIAQTYKRPELAQNILDPNKTIAQGFASELITLNDGTQQMGFITLEGATEVKLRNIAAQEFTFKTTDIKERQKLPTSMMPPGLMMNFTVYEFASLLDYLEDLSKH